MFCSLRKSGRTGGKSLPKVMPQKQPHPLSRSKTIHSGMKDPHEHSHKPPRLVTEARASQAQKRSSPTLSNVCYVLSNLGPSLKSSLRSVSCEDKETGKVWLWNHENKCLYPFCLVASVNANLTEPQFPYLRKMGIKMPTLDVLRILLTGILQTPDKSQLIVVLGLA